MESGQIVDPSADGIKRVRKTLGLSQAELALKLGYSRNYVTLMEIGRKPITDGVVSKLRLLVDQSPSRASPALGAGTSNAELAARLDRMQAELDTLTKLLGAALATSVTGTTSDERKKVG